MQVNLGVKLRLYPNQSQQEQLVQMFGNDRKVWNLMLEMANQRYQNNPSSQFLNAYDMNYLLKRLKQELPYLKLSDSSSLQVVTHNLEQSFKMLFKHHGGHPRFHSFKSCKKSYTGKAKVAIIAKRYMKLPKLGYIKTSKTNQVTRLTNYRIKRYTVTLAPDDRYYLSLSVVCDSQALPKTGKVVGLDMGLSDLMVPSVGKPVKKFTHKHLDYKIKLAQRKYDRRRHQAKVVVRQFNHTHPELAEMDETDYQNWQTERRHKARLQAHLVNQRRDYLQKETTKLVKQYDVIVIEDLHAKNMMKNHKLANSVANASWRMIREMLTYKCKKVGKQLVIVNPRNTSRICHNCGRLQKQFKDLTMDEWLATREWKCEACGAKQDRDQNAAINILQRGLQKLNNY